MKNLAEEAPVLENLKHGKQPRITKVDIYKLNITAAKIEANVYTVKENNEKSQVWASVET
jgi:hypothetical protein